MNRLVAGIFGYYFMLYNIRRKHMRNVFVSYSHRLDQDVVDEFRRKFGNDKMVFSDCSLETKI